jgi:hypothetical protein
VHLVLTACESDVVVAIVFRRFLRRRTAIDHQALHRGQARPL